MNNRNFHEALKEVSLSSDVRLYDALYTAAQAEPEAFWEDIASHLEWEQKWAHTSVASEGARRWFVGGKINYFDTLFADKNPAHDALVIYLKDGTRTVYTWETLRTKLMSIGSFLRSHKVQAGDIVCISVEDKGVAALYGLACLAIGARFCYSYFKFPAQILENQIDLLGIKAIIYEHEPRQQEGVPDFSSRKTLTTIFSVDAIPEQVQGQSIVSLPPIAEMSDVTSFAAHTFDAEDITMFYFTSGTTAVPKAIPSGSADVYVSGLVAYYLLFSTQDKSTLITMDFAWGPAVIPCFIVPLLIGEKVVVDTRHFQPQLPHTYDVMESEKIGSLLVPIAQFEKEMAGQQQNKKYDVKKLCLGGMQLSNRAITNIVTLFNQDDFTICFGYGSSEIGGLAFFNRSFEDHVHNDFTILTASLGITHSVVDETDELAERGRLRVKNYTPGFCKGIVGDEARYAQLWSPDYAWFISDDLAEQCSEKTIRFLGRADTMIKVKGRYLDTALLEEKVSSKINRPVKLLDIPTADGAQRLVLFVEVTSVDGLESLITEEISSNIGTYALPKYIVAIDCFPRTASQKIQMGELTKIFLDEHEQ